MITVVVALVLGFLVGLFTFKTKNRWCPQCGTTTMSASPTDAPELNRV